MDPAQPDRITDPTAGNARLAPRWCLPAVALAAAVGVGLMAGSAWATSATYDEVAYLRTAARWWRTGAQGEITRMGSPLTFWKLQQAPTLWLLDRTGRRDLVDEPMTRQADLLPLVRLGSLWVWLTALGLTAFWSRRLYGPRAMAFAAWLFALSPNLLAHGAVATMELPIVAASAGVGFLFWRYLETGRACWFWASSALSGLAFSCKFTAVLLPPLLGLAWWVDLAKGGRRPVVAAWRVGRGMAGFLAVMALADWAVTGFALMPLSHSAGTGHPSLDGRFAGWPWFGRLVTRAVETPIPQDWVGFATQTHHQRSGGSSYLLGERRTTGWWSYYLVALAVKVPLSFWLLAAVRAGVGRRGPGRDWMFPVVIAAFLAVTAAGSSRNYGLRYLLPLSPLAIVWVSSLAERGRLLRAVAVAGLAGQALATATVHPHELTYFNALAGGRLGGRHVLADSNLDWGQGLRSFARLQRDRPALRDVTLYYFGDTDPRHYSVAGLCHRVDAGSDHPGLPARFEATTPYVAVSASLQWGPWGPGGYFRPLDGVKPLALTADTTIAVYRSADIPFRSGSRLMSPVDRRKGR